MDIKYILSKVDHTLLKVDATENDIKRIIEEGVDYGVASVCIPPSYVAFAAEYVKEYAKSVEKQPVKVCTVIGFPNGYATKESKCFETSDAFVNGADEVDMVVNIGHIKDKKYDMIEDEIKSIMRVCDGKTLKVIIETCLLTEEEKVEMCKLVSRAEAAYIKTSTGFSTGGATFEDVELMAKNVDKKVCIKAAGGISSLEDAEKFLSLGADRLGTSRIVKLVQQQN